MRAAAILAIFLCFSCFALAGGKGEGGRADVKCVFDDDCDELLIEQVGAAEKELAVAIFSFTNRKIARAYIKAAERGVKVRVKYDEGQSDWVGMREVLQMLREAGISCTAVKMSEENAGMHNKFTVVDGSRVLTGSFNYSTAGSQRNYENLVLISSKSIAELYLKEFEGIVSR